MPLSGGSEQWIAAAVTADGLISAVTNSAEQLTGYAPEELTTLPLSRIVEESGCVSVADMLQGARDWGVWAGDILLRDRSGKTWEARATLTLLAGRGQDATTYLLISTLVRESAGRASGAQAYEISARLREFAHALNNPLAIIMGFTQLMLLDGHCDQKTRTDLERIHAELRRVIRIMEKFHAYAMSLCPQSALQPTRQ